MNTLLIDLERNQERLKYYTNQLEKNPTSTMFSKWIEIYSDRAKKLEKQAIKLGLTTDVTAADADQTQLAN